MTLTPSDWRLAEALHVQREYGDRAPLYIAEQIGFFLDKGDNAGALRWREIAGALSELLYGTRQ